MNAAITKAQETGIPVSIAVVDSGGHLISFARLDSVYGVIDFAVKARTAVMFGTDSDIMGSIIAGSELHGYGMINSNNGLLTIAGGTVIKIKKAILSEQSVFPEGLPNKIKKLLIQELKFPYNLRYS